MGRGEEWVLEEREGRSDDDEIQASQPAGEEKERKPVEQISTFNLGQERTSA